MKTSFHINGSYLLQKFNGKGGWTYIALPEIKVKSNLPFGWLEVRGSIDHIELNHYKLMPMGNGQLFLPVKAAWRKALKKEAGDYAHVILQPEDRNVIIPKELEETIQLQGENLWEFFLKWPEHQKSQVIQEIYQTKNQETKTKRILKLIKKIEQQG